MNILTARIVLFTIWLLFFTVYIVITFLPTLPSWNNEVSIKLAKETMWKYVYVLFPVLVSFAAYWFNPKQLHPAKKAGLEKKLSGSQVYAMFVLTFFLHAFVLGYYYFTVLLVKYRSPPSIERPEVFSYTENVDDVIKLLVFVSAGLIAPVGYVLGEKVALGSPAPPDNN